MKVKIGDKVYSPEEQPIMLILEPIDKLSIMHMKPEVMTNCWHPRGMPKEKIIEFMNGTDVKQTEKPELEVAKKKVTKKKVTKKKVTKKK